MGEDDLLSLDFTAIEPSPAPELARAELVPDIAAATATPGSSPPVQPVLRTQLPVALIEAAALHAAGDSLSASRRLEAALKSGELLGDAARRVWLALFEMLQELGRRPAFETLALAYARRFEQSPPAWTSAGDGGGSAGESTGGLAQIALSGKLSAKAQVALDQVLKLAQTNSIVRLNLAKLTGADDDGCAALLRTLTAMKAATKECLLGAPEHLAEVLAGHIEMGRREHEPMWLLLLQLYQHANQPAAFEDAAVNYAVTFEVSPPSWVVALSSVPTAEVSNHAQTPANGLFLRGELLGASPSDFAALEVAAADSNEITLDATELVRIDDASANILAEVLKRWATAGKTLSITGLSQMAFAFLVGRDFDVFVELKTRKN